MRSLPTFFRGGIQTLELKEPTASLPIETFTPQEVAVPLSQHAGSPAKSLVKRKDRVVKGDCIGEAGPDGANVHATVSGTVKRVAKEPHPTLVESEAVVIETDFSIPEPVWEEDPKWENLPKEILLERIQKAGIVGLGGAAFPTHRKLTLPEGVSVDTLLVNGAECEPYLTGDHRLMLEQPEVVLQGSFLFAKILGAKKIIFGIEENKKNAADTLQQHLKNFSSPCTVEIALCETRYPQGSEKQLIQTLTGRRVPAGLLPFHVGVVVQNVATAAACYEAIRFRKPLVERILTVSGGGILFPKNLCVPIGTLLRDIIAHCGGLHPKAVKVIAGGPMMGRALGRLDVPVVKGTSGLVILRTDEVQKKVYGPCISCGTCLSACPLGLEPNQISIYTEAGRALETEPFGTRECFECGCCAYVCPASRPLVQFIQMAKNAFQTGSSLGLAVLPGGRP